MQRAVLLMVLVGCEATTTGLVELGDAGRVDSGSAPDAGVPSSFCGQGAVSIGVFEKDSFSRMNLRYDGIVEIIDWLPTLQLELDDGRRVFIEVSAQGVALPPRPVELRAGAVIELRHPFWSEGSVVLTSLSRAAAAGLAFGAWSGAISPPPRVAELQLDLEAEPGCVDTTMCGTHEPDSLIAQLPSREIRVPARTTKPMDEWTVVNGASHHAIGAVPCLDSPGRWSSGMVFRAVP